jgi:hypothetical protein
MNGADTESRWVLVQAWEIVRFCWSGGGVLGMRSWHFAAAGAACPETLGTLARWVAAACAETRGCSVYGAEGTVPNITVFWHAGRLPCPEKREALPDRRWQRSDATPSPAAAKPS